MTERICPSTHNTRRI